MKGSEAYLLSFMDGSEKQYIIPVYQRKYDWKTDNCRQLYEDLKRIIFEHRESHFFGSIVSSVEGNGSRTEFHIIDGQQRLTTVSLLLLAMRNMIQEGKLVPREDNLARQINNRFLEDEYAKSDDKTKLRPVKSDRVAYKKLLVMLKIMIIRQI